MLPWLPQGCPQPAGRDAGRDAGSIIDETSANPETTLPSLRIKHPAQQHPLQGLVGKMPSPHRGAGSRREDPEGRSWSRDGGEGKGDGGDGSPGFSPGKEHCKHQKLPG